MSAFFSFHHSFLLRSFLDTSTFSPADLPKVRRIPPFLLYTTLFLLLFFWWILAFSPFSQAESPQDSPLPLHSSPKELPLSTLSRDELHCALLGDTQLAVRLIKQWDVDAQFLHLTRLTPEERDQVDQLHRLLHHTPSQLRSSYQQSHTPSLVTDDQGQSISPPSPSSILLPQTYVAASFLSALCSPQNIAAIPKGIREQPHLFSPDWLAAIPLDTERANAEAIFLKHPSIALVASYSAPSAIEAFRQQGMDVMYFDHLESLSQIRSAFLRTAYLAQSPLKGELLTLFMRAAEIHLQNRLNALRSAFPQQTLPRTLFLQHFTDYRTPSRRTLSASLLRTLELDHLLCEVEKKKGNGTWSHPLTAEEIIQLQPECLLLADDKEGHVRTQFLQNSAFQQLPAIQKGHLFSVDEETQMFPSQFALLSLYDLFHAIEQMALQKEEAS